MRAWERVGWVSALLVPRKAPIPWPRMLRTGVAVGIPVSVGYATGLLGPGVVCSLGALAASIADPSGPYRARVARIGAVSVGGILGFLLGGVVVSDPALANVSILIGGAISGIVSVLGGAASRASLQFLIYLIVAANVSFGSGPVWVSPVCYLLGAGLALALTLAGGIGRASAPEREAVAGVYVRLANLLEACGTEAAEPARVQLTGALSTAYDAMVSFREREAGRNPRIRALAAVLNASTPVVEAAVTVEHDGARVPLRLIADTRAIAIAVGSGSRAELGQAVTLGEEDDEHLALAQIELGLRVAAHIIAGGRVEGAGLPSSTRAPFVPRLRDAVLGGTATWLPIVRLVLCLGIAELAGRFSPAERPYWIAMTVAVTLKPDFGSVFARAVLRGTGTIVGVAIGGFVLLVIPGIPLLLAVTALFAAALPFAQQRNYGMFATFLTPVIVLLLDLSGGGDAPLVAGRLIDTAIGCAVVLLFGYLPWPDTWRSHSEFSGRIADAADAVNHYLRIAVGRGEGSRRTARRGAYRRLGDVRTRLQQALAEPPPVSRQAAAWWPSIVALERVADATTAFAVRHNPLVPTRSAGEGPADPGATRALSAVPGDADAVIRFSEAVANAVREHRKPPSLDLPDRGPLADVAAELRTAAAVVSGPGRGEQR